MSPDSAISGNPFIFNKTAEFELNILLDYHGFFFKNSHNDASFEACSAVGKAN